jgi:hypothetical protein
MSPLPHRGLEHQANAASHVSLPGNALAISDSTLLTTAGEQPAGTLQA